MCTLVSILFTNPFLKFPYDMFTHLQLIDEQSLAHSIPKGRGVWHYFWAQIFHFLHIDCTEIFTRAYIIHYVQSITSFLMLFYFSKVLLRNLFSDILFIDLNYLAYWATIIWFIILSTESGYYHQVWILWYSINYQISLPLTLLMTGLTMSFLFESLSYRIKLIQILIILLLSYIILRIHAMEFIYFLMFMGILMLVYSDKILVLWKKYIYLAFPLTLLFLYIFIEGIEYIKTYAYRQAPIFNYLSFEKLPQLLDKIHFNGQIITQHYSKTMTTLNELVYISLLAISILLIIVIFRWYKKYPLYVNIRFVFFLFITSFFILIPVFEFTSGLASLLTYKTIAYRFYFSSLLFLALPALIFYIFKLFKVSNIWIINLGIFFIIVSTFLYSKYNIESYQNFYKNIMSIKKSFNQKNVGFNLSKENMKLIGEKLKYYESLNKGKKPIYFYARDDIAFVIKFIYRKQVLYSRRGSWDHVKSYYEHNNIKYKPILFETPIGFPAYTRFK